MYSDTIADMLTRIRNGYMAKKTVIVIPFSKVKLAIAESLTANSYLKSVKETKDGKKRNLEIALLYKDNQPAIKKLIRVSKSGLRVYQKTNKLPYVLSGLGKSIISTSQGIMTADEARKKSLGGEVICKVW
jgi:small subunit ribosomal protein S8